jgi:hypothetical protein
MASGKSLPAGPDGVHRATVLCAIPLKFMAISFGAFRAAGCRRGAKWLLIWEFQQPAAPARVFTAAPETAQRSTTSGLRAGSLPCDRGGARVLVVAPRRKHEPPCVFCCAFRRLPVHSFCRSRLPACAHKIRLMRLMRKTAEPGDVEPVCSTIPRKDLRG